MSHLNSPNGKKRAEHSRLETPNPKHASSCCVEDWLSFLGHRWTALILWHLSTGTKRHGELSACLVGVRFKVLAERLAALEKRDLVERREAGVFPRRVSYALTARGCSLTALLDGLELWTGQEA